MSATDAASSRPAFLTTLQHHRPRTLPCPTAALPCGPPGTSSAQSRCCRCGSAPAGRPLAPAPPPGTSAAPRGACKRAGGRTGWGQSTSTQAGGWAGRAAAIAADEEWEHSSSSSPRIKPPSPPPPPIDPPRHPTPPPPPAPHPPLLGPQLEPHLHVRLVRRPLGHRRSLALQQHNVCQRGGGALCSSSGSSDQGAGRGQAAGHRTEQHSAWKGFPTPSEHHMLPRTSTPNAHLRCAP